MSAVIHTTAAQSAIETRAALTAGAGDRAIAFDARGDIALERFHREVRGVAAALPEAPYAINLCEDRYRFLVAFCAAAVRGQVTLLPSSRAAAVVDEVLAGHPGSYCLGDHPLTPQPPHYHCLPPQLPQATDDALTIDADALVAIGFTSGSTGQPTPNRKYWHSLQASTVQNLAALSDLLDRDGST